MTKDEEIRLKAFEEKCVELEGQGFIRKNLMVSALKANFGSLVVMLPIIILFVLLFFVVNHGRNEYGFINLLICYVVFIVLIVIHELIHGICWAICNEKHWKSIDFGFNVKALAPYCTCSETLTKKQYIVGAVMPTLILGFLPAILSVIIGNVSMLIVSVFMIIGGGGDFLMIINILKFKPEAKEIIYYDHPTEIGTVAFYK